MSVTSRGSAEDAGFSYTKPLDAVGSWIASASESSPVVSLLVADPVACLYLQRDPMISPILPEKTIYGFEAYVVEDWACSRKQPSVVVCTETKNNSHRLVVSVFSIPTDISVWSPVLCSYFDSFKMYQAEPCDTGVGTLMVMSTSSFISGLNSIRIPQGDIHQLMTDFVVNLNLKRLECTGRAQLTLSKRNDATVAKFKQYETSDSWPVDIRVIELVRVIQTCLFLFGKLGADCMDGFLCDVTRAGLANWWVEFGSEHFNRPADQPISPPVIAALFGLLAGARYRLASLDASVGKNVLDVRAMMRGIEQFQQQNNATLSVTGHLDLPTFRLLHKKTLKLTQEKIRTGQRTVISTLAGLGGTGMEMMMGIVSRDKGIADIETDVYSHFVNNISDETVGWVWSGKGKKCPSGGSFRVLPMPYLLFSAMEMNIYSPNKRAAAPVYGAVAGDTVESDAGEKPSYFFRAGRRMKGVVRHGHLPRQSKDSNSSVLGQAGEDAGSTPEDYFAMTAKASQQSFPEANTPGSHTPTTSSVSRGVSGRIPIPTISKLRLQPSRGSNPSTGDDLAASTETPLSLPSARAALPLTPNPCSFDQCTGPDVSCFSSLDIDNDEVQLLEKMCSILRRSQSETRLSDLHPIRRAKCVKMMEKRTKEDAIDLDHAAVATPFDDMDEVFDARLPRSASFSVAEEAVLWWPRVGVYPIRPARARAPDLIGETGNTVLEDEMEGIYPGAYDSDSDSSSSLSVDMSVETNRPGTDAKQAQRVCPTSSKRFHHKRHGSRWGRMIAHVSAIPSSTTLSPVTSPSSEFLLPQTVPANSASFPSHSPSLVPQNQSNTQANNTPVILQLESPVPEPGGGLDLLGNSPSAPSVTPGSVQSKAFPGNPSSMAVPTPGHNTAATPTALASVTRQVYLHEVGQRTTLGLIRSLFVDSWLQYVIPAQADLLALRSLDQYIVKLSSSIEQAIPNDLISQMESLENFQTHFFEQQPNSQNQQFLQTHQDRSTSSRMPTQAAATLTRPTISQGYFGDLEDASASVPTPPLVRPDNKSEELLNTPPNTGVAPSFDIHDFDDEIAPSIFAINQARYARDELTKRVIEFEAELDRFEREVCRIEKRMLDVWDVEIQRRGRRTEDANPSNNRKDQAFEQRGSQSTRNGSLLDKSGEGKGEHDEDVPREIASVAANEDDDSLANLSATAKAIRQMICSLSVPTVVQFLSRPTEWLPAMEKLSADTKRPRWWSWEAWLSRSISPDPQDGVGQS